MAQSRLSRDQIVRTAIAFVDAHGLDFLTMRRLGDTLEVEAMALYRHITGRDDLLDSMVDNLIDGLFENPLMTENPASWEDYLQRVAHATLQMAESHPEMFPLIATHPSEAPWLRPPLRSLRWVEHFLSTLQSFSFSDEDTVTAYKAFTSFLIGDLLLHVHSTTFADLVGADSGEEGETASAEYPTVNRLNDLLSQDHRRREFEDGLDDLIERIRTVLAR